MKSYVSRFQQTNQISLLGHYYLQLPRFHSSFLLHQFNVRRQECYPLILFSQYYIHIFLNYYERIMTEENRFFAIIEVRILFRIKGILPVHQQQTSHLARWNKFCQDHTNADRRRFSCTPPSICQPLHFFFAYTNSEENISLVYEPDGHEWMRMNEQQHQY